MGSFCKTKFMKSQQTHNIYLLSGEIRYIIQRNFLMKKLYRKLYIIFIGYILLIFCPIVSQTIYADAIYVPDCGNPTGQEKGCICVTKQCPGEGATKSCFPDMGPNPSADLLQQMDNKVSCSTTQPQSPPSYPFPCPTAGSGTVGELNA